MAQTRLEKIGTIYSRLKGLQKSGAVRWEDRPLWFDIYEAFPPKYEPRWDRHQLGYGSGGNIQAMGPPRKILYQEDMIRAKFYKVFAGDDRELPKNVSVPTASRRVEETFSLFEGSDDNLSAKECLAEKFIRKYQDLEARGGIPKASLFRAATEALELQEGINLLGGGTFATKVETDPAADVPEQVPKARVPSMKEIFKASNTVDGGGT